MNDSDVATLLFPSCFDDRAVTEMEWKGWVNAAVRLPNGSTVAVSFYDPVRFSQDLETDQKAGNAFIAEPGMIVVPSVPLGFLTDAVGKLHKAGFFEGLVPMTDSEAQDLKPWVGSVQ